MKRSIALTLAAVVFAAAADTAPPDAVTDMLAQAKAKHMPVLVDFHAPWCYSCYFMASHVQTGADWDRARRQMLTMEMDADSPDGAARMKEWHIKALPSYVLLGSDGQELGRLIAEHTKAEFYKWLFDAAAQGATLESLQAKVVDHSGASVAAAREVLRAYHARYDFDGGLKWFLALPPKTRAAVGSDTQAALWISRLELLRAAAAEDGPACAKASEPVLSGDLGCERPYDLDRVIECTKSGVNQDARQALLQPQADYMRALFEKRVLADTSRCADERSIVLTTADLYAALKDKAAEQAVLDRAITELKARIGKDLGKDRNLADNLRVYLDRAGRTEELDRLYPQLIAAYPKDYVYNFRFGKSLELRGKHAEALPYFEAAAEKAYGVNALRNAELRAKSLKALNRNDEARAVLAKALKDNGAWFPEDAAKLKALQDELGPAAGTKS